MNGYQIARSIIVQPVVWKYCLLSVYRLPRLNSPVHQANHQIQIQINRNTFIVKNTNMNTNRNTDTRYCLFTGLTRFNSFSIKKTMSTKQTTNSLFPLTGFMRINSINSLLWQQCPKSKGRASSKPPDWRCDTHISPIWIDTQPSVVKMFLTKTLELKVSDHIWGLPTRQHCFEEFKPASTDNHKGLCYC